MNLRPYQNTAINSVYSYFQKNNGNPVICLPTGAGKSIVIAALCKDILVQYSNQRILILSHVKELIAQNHDKIKQYWPEAPSGIYSASLNRKQHRHPITVATIQSVYQKAELLGHRDLVLIDEAHLVSAKDTGMYLHLLTELWKINPHIKVVGLSATPYRLDNGMLHEGGLFTDLAIDVPVMELVEQGYLSRLISRVSEIQADLSRVNLVAGEFNAKQMSAAFESPKMAAAVREVMELCNNRKSILVFCTSIEHAERVAAQLSSMGIESCAVSSKTPHAERDTILEDFKAGTLRCITSVNVVSTGFDAPNVDCVVLLRATMSPGLYVQMVGRGLRIAERKENCLVLDYGGNILRHGPITDITPPRKGRKRNMEATQEPKVKVCKVCRMASPLTATECAECGMSLIVERDGTKKLEKKAADHDIMASSHKPDAQWFDVDATKYYHHRKAGSPNSLMVEYQCGLETYKEWVCLCHTGFARQRAVKWWIDRTGSHLVPITVESAMIRSAELKKPKRVKIRQNGKYTEVMGYEFYSA